MRHLIVLLAVLLVLLPTTAQEDGDTIAEFIVAAADDTPAEYTLFFDVARETYAAAGALLENPNADVTLLLPTDAAFNALMDDFGVTRAELLAETDLLTDIARYHILDTVLMPDDLTPDTFIPTLLADDEVLITQSGASFAADGVALTPVEVGLSNGMIYTVDSVILPDGVSSALAQETSATMIDLILDYATRDDDPQFTLLIEALLVAEDAIVNRLEDPSANLTFMAPSDDAFRALLGDMAITESDLLADTETLNDILRYHIIEQRLASEDIAARAGTFLPTLLGSDDVLISATDDGLFVDNARITDADIDTSNGPIHIIDALLIPDGARAMTPSMTGNAPTASTFVLDTARDAANPDLTLLLLALSEADPALFAHLSDETAELTLFAPTDTAFLVALAALGMTAEELFARPDLLTEIVGYHIAETPLTTDNLTDGMLLETRSGEVIRAAITDEGPRLNDSAHIVVENVQLSNGVLHIINAVLLPPSLAARTEADAEQTLADVIAARATGDGADLATLLALLDDAGMLADLNDPARQWTLLAPNDDAFAVVDTAALTDAQRTAILQHHLIDEALLAESLAQFDTIITQQGAQLALVSDDDGLTIDGARVVVADIETTNGVLHIIDAVLTPPDAE